MKKIFFLITASFLFAFQTKYEKYINELQAYSFKLNYLDKIHSPFYMPIKIKKLNNVKVKNRKSINILPLCILNHSALVKIKITLNNKNIKENKKWIKVNSKIGSCKVESIYENSIKFKCNNKTVIKKLNNFSLKNRM